jgi:peroxiredoxin
MTTKIRSPIADARSKAAQIIEAPNEKQHQRVFRASALGQWPPNALKAGDHAIEFCLPDRQGRKVSLSKCLLAGPVLLMVSQGMGYGNLTTQLLELAALYPRIRAQSVTLIVLAPHWDASGLDDLAFHTLIDSHCSVATAYGLALQADAEPRPHSQPIAYGEEDANLLDPLVIPATYVISRSGQILFASIDANAAHCLQPNALLRMLEALSRRQSF